MNPVTTYKKPSYGTQSPYGNTSSQQSVASTTPTTNSYPQQQQTSAYNSEPTGYSSSTSASGTNSSSSSNYTPAMGSVASGILYEDPAEEALKYTGGMEDMLLEYLGPYREKGLKAQDALFREFLILLNNPSLKYDSLTGGFEESPGYQYTYDQSMNAVNQAAAAGGMSGSPAHQQQASEQSAAVANQEFYNYVDDMMQLYFKGLGIGGDINQMGYGASSTIAETLAQNIWKEAQLGALSQMGKNQSSGSIWGGTTDLVTSLF